MRAVDGVKFTNVGTAGTGSFQLAGGNYFIVANAGTSWGNSTLGLSVLAADEATYIPVLNVATHADAVGTISLPAGSYEFVVSNGTGTPAINLAITRIPGE